MSTHTTFKVGLESAGMLMTPEEFDAIDEYDDVYCYELIHGVLVVTPIPSEAESDPNEELGHLLRSYQESHPQGSALDKTPCERYVRTHDSRRRADRLVWAGLGRLPDTRADVPQIAIEFLSSGRRNRKRDYEEKRSEYMVLGIVEYWIIDRFQRTLAVFRSAQGEHGEKVFPEDTVYRPALLPGFELPLARLLKLADAWGE